MSQNISQERIDLSVKYEEKDVVKALGAKWDLQQKVWYIPAGLDKEPFKKWLPAVPDFRLRSNNLYIGTTQTKCWRCSALTNVHCIALLQGHTKIFQYGAWESWHFTVFPYFVMEISLEAKVEIKKVTSGYYEDFSKKGGRYFVNHCQSCKTIIGDFNMYVEPEGEFALDDPTIFQKIEFINIAIPIEIGCNGHLSDPDIKQLPTV